MADYVILPARYAKNMFAVSIVRDGSVWKTRADRLIGDGLNCRWSGREYAYIASASKVRKFEDLYGKGWDASPITGKLWPPKEGEASAASCETSANAEKG